MSNIPDLQPQYPVSVEQYIQLSNTRLPRQELVASSIVGLAFTATSADSAHTFYFFGTTFIESVVDGPIGSTVTGYHQPRTAPVRQYKRIVDNSNFMTLDRDPRTGIFKAGGFFFAVPDSLFDDQLWSSLELSLV